MPMYQTVHSFIEEYEDESSFTEKLLRSITDAALKEGEGSSHRALGRLAWHLVPTGGILRPTGLQFQSPPEGSDVPDSAAAIADAYSATAASLIEAVRTQWNDDNLQESAEIFGQPWQNGYTLAMHLKHEIHHRGQLTILMRQAGLPIFGIYGPTKEEWTSLGMEAPL